jgi:hypothetical protein
VGGFSFAEKAEAEMRADKNVGRKMQNEDAKFQMRADKKLGASLMSRAGSFLTSE